MPHAPRTRSVASASRPVQLRLIRFLLPLPAIRLSLSFPINMFANPFNRAVTVLDARVTVHDESAIASSAMDKLVNTAVFGDPDDREDARWLIWEIGQAVAVQPASIHDLYLARGRGECA